MAKIDIKEGMVLTLEEVYENQVEILSIEEYNDKKKQSDDSHDKFLKAEQWRKYIKWKPTKIDYYAIKIEDGKYNVKSIKHYSNDIASLYHIQENLDALFTYHPMLNTFKYNEFTNYNEFNGMRWDEDKKPQEIFNFFKRNFNEWCPRTDIKETIQETLNRNTYHPIKDWLKSLIWDGEERLETFLIDYYGAEDTQLNRVYFKRWMLALIKRILYPGAKFDSMLILAGEQGKKKTTLFNWLGTINGIKYYSEAPDNLKDINSVVYASLGKIIMTFDDFDDICNKGDLGKVKSFITTQERTAALKWKHQNEYAITYVLGATTNIYEILVDDDTFDERRFWIVYVNPTSDIFNIPEEIKEQLYAEAYYTFLQDENIRLWIWENELKEEEQELQKKYKKAYTDPMTEKLVSIFSRKYELDNNGMFKDENDFISQVENNLNLSEDESDFLGTSYENKVLSYIKRIPISWLQKYIKNDGSRSGPRIVQILHTQGFKVSKESGIRCYGAQLTVLDLWY